VELRGGSAGGRRIKEGLSKREIIRCLKRYVAREVFAALQPPTALANTA
jgi:transposase